MPYDSSDAGLQRKENKKMMPTFEDLNAVVQSFKTGNIPFYKGYNYIPEFKKHIFAAFESKITVTAAIRCSDILTAQYASKFKLDREKYQAFVEVIARYLDE